MQFWGHPGHGTGISADFVCYLTNRSFPHEVTTAIFSNNLIGADLTHEFFQKKIRRIDRRLISKIFRIVNHVAVYTSQST